MDIRLASSEDVPEIVSVLRKSLGESKLPKSEEIWNFKHNNNPFGKSLVLLAIVDAKIVGVRSFMRWKWQFHENQFSCLRAVDTATLPDYQGKGIFKKLTLRAVEMAATEGDHLVFNTPNSQSMPGYLKMGWERVDKLSIKIIPSNPMDWKFKKEVTYKTSEYSSFSQIQDLTRKYNQLLQDNGILFTPKSSEYLEWRYFNNPLQEYEILAEEDFFISGYVKNHKYFRELRITEAIFLGQDSVAKVDKAVRNLAKDFGVQVISISGASLVKDGLLGSRQRIGPMLTLKNLNLDNSLHLQLLNIKNWGYSLGDLELF